MATELRRAEASSELFTTLKWMEGFDLEAARSSDDYRSARLALLGMRAHSMFERTDTSAREVEAALAEARSSLRAMDGERPARNQIRRLPLAVCDL
jgi:hypothetical protein